MAKQTLLLTKIERMLSREVLRLDRKQADQEPFTAEDIDTLSSLARTIMALKKFRYEHNVNRASGKLSALRSIKGLTEEELANVASEHETDDEEEDA